MAYTINLKDDFITAEEWQRTKEAILKKLRAQFGDYTNRDGWDTAHSAGAKDLPLHRTSHGR